MRTTATLACLLVLSACGDGSDQEETGTSTAPLDDEEQEDQVPKARLLVAECDTNYVTSSADGYESHAVAIFAVPVEAVRSAWACDPAPRENAGPEECVGVLPFTTPAGSIAVPCMSDDGYEYRQARLVIEH